jgi:hypothetical protein
VHNFDRLFGNSPGQQFVRSGEPDFDDEENPDREADHSTNVNHQRRGPQYVTLDRRKPGSEPIAEEAEFEIIAEEEATTEKARVTFSYVVIDRSQRTSTVATPDGSGQSDELPTFTVYAQPADPDVRSGPAEVTEAPFPAYE